MLLAVLPLRLAARTRRRTPGGKRSCGAADLQAHSLERGADQRADDAIDVARRAAVRRRCARADAPQVRLVQDGVHCGRAARGARRAPAATPSLARLQTRVSPVRRINTNSRAAAPAARPPSRTPSPSHSPPKPVSKFEMLRVQTVWESLNFFAFLFLLHFWLLPRVLPRVLSSLLFLANLLAHNLRARRRRRRRRSLFVFNGYYRGTQGARC